MPGVRALAKKLPQSVLAVIPLRPMPTGRVRDWKPRANRELEECKKRRTEEAPEAEEECHDEEAAEQSPNKMEEAEGDKAEAMAAAAPVDKDDAPEAYAAEAMAAAAPVDKDDAPEAYADLFGDFKSNASGSSWDMAEDEDAAPAVAEGEEEKEYDDEGACEEKKGSRRTRRGSVGAKKKELLRLKETAGALHGCKPKWQARPGSGSQWQSWREGQSNSKKGEEVSEQGETLAA